MRNLIISFVMICLPLNSWAENGAVLDALEDFLEFAEYAEGAITSDQIRSIGQVEFYLVDTRSENLYAKGHIPGAVNIEWREVIAKRHLLPVNKPVLLYCDTGLLSSKAHFALRLLGHENVKVLFGGYNSWLMQQGP